MGLFDRIKPRTAADRLQEERIYELVATELKEGVRREGLWAKAIGKCDGDEAKAKSLYVEYRVQSIIDEIEVAAEKRKQDEIKAAEAAREAAKAADEASRHNAERQARKDATEESRLVEEAVEILIAKGYRPRKEGPLWIVVEPLGGRKKTSSGRELYEYACSRLPHVP